MAFLTVNLLSSSPGIYSLATTDQRNKTLPDHIHLVWIILNPLSAPLNWTFHFESVKKIQETNLI